MRFGTMPDYMMQILLTIAHDCSDVFPECSEKLWVWALVTTRCRSQHVSTQATTQFDDSR